MRHCRVAITFLFLASTFFSCRGGDPDLKVTRKFLDSYYVMADQKAALLLTTGHATELLNNEIALLKDVQGHDGAYKTRDVNFKLMQTQAVGDDINYFYELTITDPSVGKMIKHVNIVVDHATHKIKDFRTVD